MVRRSPQDKKQLSYAKDCRNDYGENDKASRKNLPRSRARVHRANRHRADQDLRSAIGPVDPSAALAAQEYAQRRRPRVFRKFADAPLGEYLRRKLGRRREDSGS